MTPQRPFTIVISGSECTGKTTLAASLAAEFEVPWSREYAREYVDLGHAPLDERDVDPIARGQLAAEQAADRDAVRLGSRFVVRDTDLVSTTVYSRHYYGGCPDWIVGAARQRAGDLYLLLRPDVPWVADGPQRDRPDDGARAQLHASFRAALDAIGARVVEIGGPWSARHERAVSAIRAAVEAASRPAPPAR
jgi:NadR type nicotinamide-nucleotide adenylyltransferase